MAKRAAKEAAEAAIESIGLGYDLTEDLKLKYCKRQNSATARDSRLINIMDHDKVQDMVIPGGEILIPNVPKSIKCDKGERTRFGSDVVSFQQMSELFNQELSLSGKIPSGHLNTAYEFTAVWQKDAANTKTLAFDGVFITLYNIALQKSNLLLRHHVKQAVPSSWDPAALASFIEKYGTHVIVGVKMGGKDVIYVKQQHSSPLQPVDVQKKLKDMADKRFTDGAGRYNINSDRFYERKKVLQILEEPWIALESWLHGERRSAIGKRHRSLIEDGLTLMDHLPSSSYSHTELQDIKFMSKRKGGYLNKNSTHKEWCHSVQFDPDVISMSFIPITSLLSGIHGSGFLSHAINLYLRYKPPIEELLQFLEFQLPRQWAPVFGELALGPQKKQQSTASLQFGFMGPKLYVNTTPVDVGKMPVTGLRLYLEGNKSNCLAIHLQHLSSLPKTFQLEDELNNNVSQRTSNHRYYEKIQWKSFSHVCTAPVESDEDLSIVTGAHFEVEDSGLKKILFLRLHFSKVIGAVAVRMPEWDGSPGLAQKSGLISTLMTMHFSTGQKPSPQPADVNINSALYPAGPPLPTQTPKLLRFVDTTEMTRGAQNSPGYWVVSGARLFVEKGKISLKVKFSLLTVILPDEEMPPEC